jgi:hemerythrin-like domain-containing protein
MAALLQLLEQRASGRKKLTPGDLCLLRDVVSYLHDFPDRVHHPTENLLFDRLLKRRPDLAEEVAGLRSEHEQLAEETLALLEGLEQAITGSASQRSLRAQVVRFTASQRAHMEREGRKVFGVAKTELLKSDWTALGRRTKLHADPLFGDEVQPRHRLLFEFLVHPERSSMAAMMAAGMGVQERLIDVVSALELGAAAAVGIVGQAAEAVTVEARSLLAGERHYANPLQRIIWPWHCGLLLSRTAWHSGSALLGASGRTARQVCVALLRKPAMTRPMTRPMTSPMTSP